MDGDARVHAAGTQEFVALWRAVSADDIDLATIIANGRCKVVQQVEQMGIEMLNIARAAVAQVVVELGQGSWQVGVAPPINDIEPLVAMRVIEPKAVFAGGSGSRILMFAPAVRQAIRRWATKWCCGFPMSLMP